jgi:hypothetical protein
VPESRQHCSCVVMMGMYPVPDAGSVCDPRGKFDNVERSWIDVCLVVIIGEHCQDNGSQMTFFLRYVEVSSTKAKR